MNRIFNFLLPFFAGFYLVPTVASAEPALVGHWKLQGDAQDSSGLGNHGVNHGVELTSGRFDGKSAYIEVPQSESLKLGRGDFTICAHIYTEKQLDDIVGDVVDMYDPARRRGITLSINSSAGGYQSQGTDRHVHFGIDNAKSGEWQDCGRPNPSSNYVSNSLTVYRGRLYAGTTDAKDEKDWCHVYRYDGGEKWTDCGRVGTGRTSGVLPMIVHNGDLYAATSTNDWTRVAAGNYDPSRVYRYLGGTEWEDCGQPSDNRTLNGFASFKGKLYVGGGPETWGVFVYEGDKQWKPAKLFPKDGPHRCFPHAMCRHNGKLYVAWPGAYSFDGDSWTHVGDPVDTDYSVPSLRVQVHSMALCQGKLYAGAFPAGELSEYQGGSDWKVVGRVGVDGIEVQALAVYNGKLYCGSVPRAEVCRFDGDQKLTSIKRFYSPEGWIPGKQGPKLTRKEINEMCRLTSLTVYDGKLFASTGSCTSSVKDAPFGVRGKVFSLEAGKVASYDDDLGPGWKHIAAVRNGGQLKLYIDGKLASKSSSFDPAEYDLSTDRPLRIGFGQTEHFDGKMADVRLYKGALNDAQIAGLYSKKPE